MNYVKRIMKLSVLLTIGAIAATGCANQITTDDTGKTPPPTPTISSVTPTPTKENTNPVVTINMKNYGIIRVELYPHVAPNTVNNFISLVKKGYYNHLTFHRIIPGFMIQGGDPNGNGSGGPGYSIKGEFTNNGFKNDLKHARGVISMARRAQPLDSAGSQFFIMLQPASHLDGDYAAFGKVVEGMDVVDEIAKTQTAAQGTPVAAPVMEKVTVETFGIEYPEPETIK